MTIGEIKNRVARRCRLIEEGTGGVWQAQQDEQSLQRIADAVQDGIDEFCDAHRWGWMKRRVAIVLSTDGKAGNCIGGSMWRYALPAGVQTMPEANWISIALASDLSGFQGGPVQLVDPMNVEALHAQCPGRKGRPERAAIGPATLYSHAPTAPLDADGRGAYELMVWPEPDQAYTATFQTHCRPPKVTSDNEVGQWPAVHDHTVIAYAVLAFFREDQLPESAAIDRAQTQVANRLVISRLRDSELEPNVLELPPAVARPRSRHVFIDSDGSPLM